MTGNCESKVRRFLTGCLAAAALVGVYCFATIGVSSLLMTATDISAQAKGGHGHGGHGHGMVDTATDMADTVTDMADTATVMVDTATDMADTVMAISGTAIGGAMVKAHAGAGPRQVMFGFAIRRTSEYLTASGSAARHEVVRRSALLL